MHQKNQICLYPEPIPAISATHLQQATLIVLLTANSNPVSLYNPQVLHQGFTANKRYNAAKYSNKVMFCLNSDP